MADLTLPYNGEDVVIPKEEIEALGVRPGSKIVVRPEIELKRKEWAPGEREAMHRILEELKGSWTEEQEAEYRRNRELWNQWKPRE
jgi:hypothetical protein